jgi:predicted CoA-binding protein
LLSLYAAHASLLQVFRGQPAQAANAIYRKLRNWGFEVFPVNPKNGEVLPLAPPTR